MCHDTCTDRRHVLLEQLHCVTSMYMYKTLQLVVYEEEALSCSHSPGYSGNIIRYTSQLPAKMCMHTETQGLSIDYVS